ncbi:hypothetical protein POVWA2_031290 [Plasmodium ovale wallikeri]|uniref:Uncharacterized protein n=1 Tax=Plasmodium ovale wallikeri TaxID=864142 RepID=A0A1A8YXK3_PLAOA|nr:hypothetical protein POVWA1_031570 [Plasmodium ovale wallikeri]SBT36662.1 hypothetical protein POVWA2_031290 [Plasmodium ovale wallikeri]
MRCCPNKERRYSVAILRTTKEIRASRSWLICKKGHGKDGGAKDAEDAVRQGTKIKIMNMTNGKRTKWT